MQVQRKAYCSVFFKTSRSVSRRGCMSGCLIATTLDKLTWRFKGMSAIYTAQDTDMHSVKRNSEPWKWVLSLMSAEVNVYCNLCHYWLCTTTFQEWSLPSWTLRSANDEVMSSEYSSGQSTKTSSLLGLATDECLPVDCLEGAHLFLSEAMEDPV